MVDTEVGDKIVIMNPWTLRLLIVVVFFIGVFIGTILLSILIYHGIEVIGDSIKVDNVNITVALNQTRLENIIKESPGYQTARAEPEVESFLYNGVYGWFCDDTSTYYPSLSNNTASFEARKCHLISIETESVNRTYYHENGWD